jgi:signal transduction histidine kinase
MDEVQNQQGTLGASSPPIESDWRAFDEALKNLKQVVEIRLKLGKIIRSIQHEMVRGQSYQETLDFVFSSLRAVIPYDRMGIGLLDASGERISLDWVKSTVDVRYLQQSYSISIHGSSLEGVISSRRPRIIGDLAAYLKEHPNSRSTLLALKDGIQSSLTCPVVVEGKGIGVIFFSSLKPNTYNSSHIDLFSEISEGLSLIVEQGLSRRLLGQTASKEKVFRTTIHDLRNPLGIIQGFLNVIASEDWFNKLHEESRAMFGVLNRNCEMMLSLVNDLSETNGAGRGLEINETEFQTFLDDFTRNSKMLAKAKNIGITVLKSTELPTTVRTDGIRLMQALENLISNAIKFSESGTNIIVGVGFDLPNNKLWFSVKDHGQGIPKEEFSKLFSEFGRTSVKPTRGESSTGLGLAIVRRIVEGHGGKVLVESDVGKGSTFSFFIPQDYSETLH